MEVSRVLFSNLFIPYLLCLAHELILCALLVSFALDAGLRFVGSNKTKMSSRMNGLAFKYDVLSGTAIVIVDDESQIASTQYLPTMISAPARADDNGVG